MQLLASNKLFKKLQNAYSNNSNIKYIYFIFPYNIADI
jgi:hypothetical protein